jgi:hypothetical protein
MGLVRKQRVGEGMTISGSGKSLEIRILDISGTEFHREVKFEITDQKIKSTLKLSADKGYVYVDKDIKLRVSNGSDSKEDMGESVHIDYEAPRKYDLQRREFKDALSRDPDAQPYNINNSNHPIGYYYRQEWEAMRQRK